MGRNTQVRPDLPYRELAKMATSWHFRPMPRHRPEMDWRTVVAMPPAASEVQPLRRSQMFGRRRMTRASAKKILVSARGHRLGRSQRARASPSQSHTQGGPSRAQDDRGVRAPDVVLLSQYFG